ncbi:hypothetical protein DDE82_009091 [Stemphylium lycopersici]|uniref:Uncharacterized protein n=1 Tax=Stemphylium lycopersici TaxID=183478 RepID=A0A364MRA2_STELY|nr:hypothetical protein DDE82_009091 [Stemphylium lycopersici]RAR00109.1 hypothetical protein DDE83_009154 [Stemphylium lycopersici]
MKFFTFALLSVAAPLALSLGIPSTSSEEVNQVAARANLDTIDLSLANDALVTRDLAKREIRGLSRSCWGVDGKFKFIVQGILITTTMVGNTLNYFISVGDGGSYLETVLMDFGHGTYEVAIGQRGSFPFSQGVMGIYPGRRG